MDSQEPRTNADPAAARDRNPYDLVPYTSLAYRHCHPDRLWVMARLFGLPATDPRQARVLEIGCGAGGNLVPMARQLPGASFIGIDLSQRAIADALARIERFRVPNVTAQVCDIVQIPAELGHFDYILCHGVYSWIPAPVRDALLGAIRRHLAPAGVAFVSYNALPGWRLHQVTRDLMRVHARGFDDPLEQVEQARAFVKFAAQAASGRDTAWSRTLREAAALMDQYTAEYFFHDFLAPHNEPVLLLDFVAHARAHGLRYLGDAELSHMLPVHVPEEARESLGKLANDQVGLEQYMDLVRGTGFRRTLLCHGEAELHRKLGGAEVADMYVHLRGRPGSADFDPAAPGPLGFSIPGGSQVSIEGPLAKAALAHLHASLPRELSVRELAAAARAAVGAGAGPGPEGDIADVGGGLVHAYSAELVDLAPRPRQQCCAVSAQPRADDYVRGLVAAGEDCAPNVRHEIVGLDRLDRALLLLCDGAHTHEQIVDGLVAAALEGRLSVKLDGVEQTDPALLHEAMQAALGPQLAKLLRTGLLVA